MWERWGQGTVVQTESRRRAMMWLQAEDRNEEEVSYHCEGFWSRNWKTGRSFKIFDTGKKILPTLDAG